MKVFQKFFGFFLFVGIVCYLGAQDLERAHELVEENTVDTSLKKERSAALDKSEKKSLETKSDSSRDRWTIDKIVARVNGSNVLKSDLEIPQIFRRGGVYTLEEYIVEEVFVQRAIEMHVTPSELDVERQIVVFRKQNELDKLSDVEFDKWLQEIGLTAKNFKDQWFRLLAVGNVRRAEVGEKVFISSQEVKKYYETHPAYVKEAYKLQLAHPKDEKCDTKTLGWEDLGWVNKVDLDKNFAFVVSMQKGDISKPLKTEHGYEIVKVVDKRMPRLKTLKERYIEIEKKLHKQKEEQYLKEIEKNLREKASVIYL